MKIRLGFVSNSSSSSFIVGMALIPEDRFNEISSRHPGYTHSVQSILERTSWWSSPHYTENGDYIEDSSFTGDSVQIPNIRNVLEQNPEAAILHINESGADPDYDDDGYPEYDSIEESDEWFDDTQLAVSATIQELGGDVYVGGGFNG